MYADREEERLRRKSQQRNNHLRRYSRSPSLSSVSRSVSRSLSSRSPPSRSPSPRTRGPRSYPRRQRSPSPDDRRTSRTEAATERERDLQERLRKRALMSKRSATRDSATSPSFQRSRSSRSPAGSAIVSATAAEEVSEEGDGYEERRRRRRATEDATAESSSSRSRRRTDEEEKHLRKSKRDRSHWAYSDDENDRESVSSSVEARRSRRRRRPSEADDFSSERHYNNNSANTITRRRYDNSYYYGPPPPFNYGRYKPPPPPPHYAPYPAPPTPPEHYRRRRERDIDSSRARSPEREDYEVRSVFCQQLAARLTQRDLGEFFEEHLGEGTVLDVRIVMDKVTGRSKGVGYVELKEESLVEKAIALSKTSLYGVPIVVQRTDAARNRATTTEDKATESRPNVSLPPIHIDAPNLPSAAARLYVGNLFFNLTETEIQSVFEPFGKILSIDLHREPGTQKSKGYAFVQFDDVDAAEKAIEHMNGFDLAGRNIRVGHVNATRNASGTTASQSGGQVGGNNSTAAVSSAAQAAMEAAGATATLTSSFDEGGGGGLTASSRAALMEKLSRTTTTNTTMSATSQNQPEAGQSSVPNIAPAASRGVLLKNMFNPEEEEGRDWDKELALDIQEECERKYGKVEAIKVDANSAAGEVVIRFTDTGASQKAIDGLNGRFFGGRSITASFISEGFLSSMLN